jgi:hypothetical protein
LGRDRRIQYGLYKRGCQGLEVLLMDYIDYMLIKMGVLAVGAFIAGLLGYLD